MDSTISKGKIMTHYKVIFHVDEMDKWPLVIGNTKNLIKALSDSTLTIEILANSVAVQYFVSKNQNAEITQTLLDLSKTVQFSACNNSLKSLQIDQSDLLDFVTIVPSGVAELTIKQHQGFSYIKP
jgi:hypothetical protein